MKNSWILRVVGTLVVAVVGALQTAPVAAENPIAEAAARGDNPIFVVTPGATPSKNASGEKSATSSPRRPDLLTLKDGRMIEAWNLRIVGDRLVFIVKKRGQEKGLQLARKDVASLQMQRSLADVQAEERARSERARHPIVSSRRRQPVRQREILAGRFVAHQGRFTDWTFTFNSDINKYYEHAANATEYGTFVLRNRMHQPGAHKSEVRAKGKYFLYAPGVFGNKDWILNLSEVSYTERNISPRRSIYTERLTDEVFVLNLSRDNKVFHLEWANQPGWSWSSPTQQTFYRLLTDREREVADARRKALELLFPSEQAEKRRRASEPRLARTD